jgi:hypothetical protein
MYYIHLIVSSSRIAPLIKHISFKLYLVIWGISLGIIFFTSLAFTISLRINKITSNFYQICISLTRYLTGAFTILLLIPILGK